MSNALKYQKKALSIRKKTLNINHSDFIQSYGNLSLIYNNLKEFNKALEFTKKIINIQEKTLDKNPLSLSNSYYVIAHIYVNLNILDKAIQFAKKALNIYNKNFSSNHIDVKKTKELINEIIKAQKSPYVRNITIKNFKLLKDIKLNFDKNINILIGENSSGKTSILQAISLGLLPQKNNDDRKIESFEAFITKRESFAQIEIDSYNYTKIVRLKHLY